MMNYIWTAIIILSFVCALITGRIPELSRGILEGAKNAVQIAFTLLGTMCFWNGISEIASLSGFNKIIDKILSPIIKLIFPKYSKTPAASAISANITANLLGLGNAATPLGIEAMRRIKEENNSNTADSETVRFVVINSAAVTLIPTTVASLRTAAGSEDPFSILIPVWITGMVSLTAGLLTEKILSKRWKK